MNGQNIIDFLEELVDDTLDADFALQLINNAKAIIEGARPWRMLLKEDSSKTFLSSDTYLTAKELPSDFLFDTKLILGDASGNSFEEYTPIGFEERRLYKDSLRYYIDHAGGNFHICGTVSETKTIYLYYIYEPDELTTATSPVWPTKFHKLISFLAAELWKSGVDTDVFNLEQALSHNKQASILWSMMISWDSRLKLQSMNHSTPIKSRKQPYRTNVIHD